MDFLDMYVMCPVWLDTVKSGTVLVLQGQERTQDFQMGWIELRKKFVVFLFQQLKARFNSTVKILFMLLKNKIVKIKLTFQRKYWSIKLIIFHFKKIKFFVTLKYINLQFFIYMIPDKIKLSRFIRYMSSIKSHVYKINYNIMYAIYNFIILLLLVLVF